ncbi:metal-dependent hydrolase [Aliidiomarina soli]|nr:metal-dependent hydrolase [Aliidiomarina soli]
MDPVAHALSGSAIAAAGLRRVTPLATAALLIGAVVPDIDGLILLDDYAALAHRRGVTHGIAALIVLPLLVTSLLLLWDRWVRRRRNPDARPAQAGQLFLLTALGVSLHLFFDWLNNYGVRLLMPFDDRWLYGDVLFIIDPWLWLTLGGITFLTWSARRMALVAWATLAIVLSLPMFLSELVAPAARILWLLALGALVVIRLRWPALQMGSHRVTRLTRIVLLVAAAYIGANIAGATAAREQVRAIASAQGLEVNDVMVGPVAINPLRGNVIVQSEDAYFLGQWNWLGSPRLKLERSALPSLMQDPRTQSAAETTEAQNFLSWSRYPYARVEVGDDGYTVHFYDVRFVDFDDAISGPSVELNRALEVISVD